MATATATAMATAMATARVASYDFGRISKQSKHSVSEWILLLKQTIRHQKNKSEAR